MCNIAGYIGPRDAAPVLCEMMRRESGFNGGYYTGIVTGCGSKLFTAKLLGDVDLLVSELGGDRLPGNFGLIHSRSRSGGDSLWSHPFLSNDGEIAYIANGSGGKLGTFRAKNSLSQEMERKGYFFTTATDRTIGAYPTLSDGRCVHGSETMTFLIRDFMLSRGVRLAEAMKNAYLTYPADIVGLAVSASEPGAISFARFNMPCVVARTADEVFLASTAMAFPTDRDYISITPIPECSYGTVTLRGTTVSRFAPPVPVAPLTVALQSAIRERVLDALGSAGRPLSLSELGKRTADLWPDDRVNQKYMGVYLALYDLYAGGSLEIVPCDEPGAEEGRDRNVRTTQFRMRLRTQSE